MHIDASELCTEAFVAKPYRDYALRMAQTTLARNIVALRKHLGFNQASFGEMLNTDQSNVSKWETRGVIPGTVIMGKMAECAATSPIRFMEVEWSPQSKTGNSIHPDQQPTRSADGGETASVMRMDLSYALGPGTNIDDDYVEGEPVELDIGFLRRLTPSSPDKLRIVSGIGDSMFPTIHDSEDLILDLGQRVLNLQDRIWALSLDGVGAVKRLQTIGKGRILVISDNPDVPNREASTDDIVIVGRLVGSVRRH